MEERYLLNNIGLFISLLILVVELNQTRLCIDSSLWPHDPLHNNSHYLDIFHNLQSCYSKSSLSFTSISHEMAQTMSWSCPNTTFRSSLF
jgi:hypothetical protein